MMMLLDLNWLRYKTDWVIKEVCMNMDLQQLKYLQKRLVEFEEVQEAV